METELTKRIKGLTHYYAPKMKSNMRTIRWADEVWTPSGIVDSIRFEDYITGQEDIYMCRMNSCINGHGFSDKGCVGCVHKVFKPINQLGIFTTCFEVKISYSDFKSPNGHNFYGNENYYCVPKELVSKILNEVPDDIGILAYSESKYSYMLRRYKPAKYREITDALRVELLYNAMKKWCDGATFIKK